MPVSMMVALKVSRSTIAAQRRGSVKVLVQPLNDSLEAMATLAVSSRSVRTWNSSSAPRRSSFHVAELVDAEQVGAAVAGDRLGELPVVGGLGEFVGELGGQGVADPEPGHGRGGAQGDEQVGLAGAGVADQAERLALADPVAGRQGAEHGGADAGVGVEVEVGQPFRAGEPGAADLPLGAAAVAVLAFTHEQLGQEPAVGELLPLGLVGGRGELAADGGQPQHPAGCVDRGVRGFLGDGSCSGHDWPSMTVRGRVSSWS